jgi:hypothetical protein
MQAVDSPFVSDGNVTLRDLKIAIGICSLGYRHSKIRRPLLPLRLNESRLEKRVNEFLDYMRDYYQRPEYSIVDPDPYAPPGPSYSSAPPVVSTAYHAAHGAHVSISAAWNMPIGEAYISEAFYFKNKDNQLDFMSEEDRKMQEEMKEAGVV